MTLAKGKFVTQVQKSNQSIKRSGGTREKKQPIKQQQTTSQNLCESAPLHDRMQINGNY